MNNLDRALDDISSIRRQMAGTMEFRGYGPATLATTGLFAIAAATIQQLWLLNPNRHIIGYLGIWLITALLSASLTFFRMYTRARRLHSALSDEMITMAVEQFLPSIVTGLLTTVAMVYSAPQALWLLPGLWQIIFSLGIFASCRFLPKPMLAAGGWYLVTGIGCIAAGDTHAFSPLEMGVPFGVGQLLIAAILRLSATGEQHDF